MPQGGCYLWISGWGLSAFRVEILTHDKRHNLHIQQNHNYAQLMLWSRKYYKSSRHGWFNFWFFCVFFVQRSFDEHKYYNSDSHRNQRYLDMQASFRDSQLTWSSEYSLGWNGHNVLPSLVCSEWNNIMDNYFYSISTFWYMETMANFVVWFKNKGRPWHHGRWPCCGFICSWAF